MWTGSGPNAQKCLEAPCASANGPGLGETNGRQTSYPAARRPTRELWPPITLIHDPGQAVITCQELKASALLHPACSHLLLLGILSFPEEYCLLGCVRACSPAECHWRLGVTYYLHPQCREVHTSYRLLVRITPRFSRWRQHVSPKCWRIFNEGHAIQFQKLVSFLANRVTILTL
jgi:hypothetical protein